MGGAWDAKVVLEKHGRTRPFGGPARTVLDEPFVLKAIKAVFQGRYPLLLAAAERALLYSTNATVHGNM